MRQQLARRELTLKGHDTQLHILPHSSSARWTQTWILLRKETPEERKGWTLYQGHCGQNFYCFSTAKRDAQGLSVHALRTGTKAFQSSVSHGSDWTWEEHLSRWVYTASRLLAGKPWSLWASEQGSGCQWDASTLSLVHASVCLSCYL